MKFQVAVWLALLFLPSWSARAADASPARPVLEGCSGGACLSFVPELELPSGAIVARPFHDRAVLRAHRGDGSALSDAAAATQGPRQGSVPGTETGSGAGTVQDGLEPGKVVLSSGHEVRVAPSGSDNVVTPQESASWSVRKSDGTVRRMLHRWASSSGWQLIWEAQRDFPIETDFQIQGTFREAVGLVMESLAGSDFPLQASLNSHLRLIRISKYLQGSAQ